MIKGIRILNQLYPGFIALEAKKPFRKIFQDRIISIQVLKHHLPLKIIDFRNKITTSEIEENKIKFELENGQYSINPKNVAIVSDEFFFIVDKEKHENTYFSNSYYTELMTLYETPDLNENNFEFYNQIMNDFIKTYRELTFDVRIQLPSSLNHENLIIKEKVIAYTPKELLLEREKRFIKKRKIQLSIKQLQLNDFFTPLSQKHYDTNRNTKIFESSYKDHKESNSYIESLNKAKEELYINKNYKYSLLDSFFCIESILSNFLSEEKIIKGITNKKLKNYKSEVGIGYKLNIELPLFISDFNVAVKEMLNNIDKIRGIRNDVVHENKNVTEDEAKLALKFATDFYYYIMELKGPVPNKLQTP